MNKIINIIVLLFVVGSLSAGAQTLTLSECREMALDNSFNLKSAAERIAASEDMLKAYKANNLPNISFSGGYLYSTATFTETFEGGYLPTFSPDLTTGEMVPNVVGTSADGTPIFSSYAYMPDIVLDFEVGSVFTAGLQLSQPIYMGGKISTATKLAQLGVDVAGIEMNRSRADVILAADEAFYTYMKVEEMLLSADAYYSVVEEFYRVVSSMYDRGMCTQNDLLKVQVKVNEAELMQLKARNGKTLSRMNLCYIVGLPISNTELKVVDMFDLTSVIDTTLDVSGRVEYELLAKSVEAKELEVKLAQSDFLPSVTAMASYSYVYGLELNGDVLFGSSPTLTAGVMVNIPIFHWGEGRRKVSAARREVAIAENTRADLVQKMTLELMQCINSYEESQAQVRLMERAVTQAEENLRQSGKQYAAGMETISNYLEAQALWQKSLSDLVEARSNQRLAYVRYCRTRGDEL
ncbi:MAG: TolC family protein [Rikenellaceae bacterium]